CWSKTFANSSAGADMDLAWISLAALLLVIVASCTTNIHPGGLAIVLAWIIGVYLAPLEGKSLRVKAGPAGFPVDLLLTLTGVSLLFSQSQVNGTLDRVTQWAVGLCGAQVGLMPIVFFFLAAALASIGPGNIAATALLAPVAMATAQRAKI